MSPTPGTPRRSIRVADALWDAAAAKAHERGEDLSAVIRSALERYVKRKDTRPGVVACCGATNPHCDRYAPPVGQPESVGCDHCGHSRGCHSSPVSTLRRPRRV